MRESKRGPFLACSGYPKCKESYNLDPVTNLPVPSVIETDHVCEKCGKPMALRQGARGSFLGCTGYPKCRNTMPVDDAGKPVVAVKVEVKCEKCGGPMGVKQGRRGAFLGCLNYPKCRSTTPIPDDLKEQLGEAATAPAAGRWSRPQDDRAGRNLRELRRADDRPPRPSRLLPRLRQVSQMQGDQGAGRGDDGKDRRRHRGRLHLLKSERRARPIASGVSLACFLTDEVSIYFQRADRRLEISGA